MLTVLSAGLPVSAKDILSSAMDEVFNGAIELQELTKETLRSKVRLSTRSVEIVLVVLDRVSSDLCSDIENGLYSSDKYFTYTTDRDLADFLNNKYGLNIVVEEEIIEDSVEQGYEVDNDLLKELEDKIKFKEDIILNLESTIKGFYELYGEESDCTPISDLKTDNEQLNKEMLDLKSQLGFSEAKAEELERLSVQQKASISELESKLAKLSKNYNSLLSELNSLKVSHSKLSGVLHDKEEKIKELLSIIEKLEKSSEDIKLLTAEISNYKTQLNNKDRIIGDLKVDLDSKDRELTRNSIELESLRDLQSVSEELDTANKTIESLKEEISSISSESIDLKKKLNEANNSVKSVAEENKGYVDRISELEKENSELSSRIANDSESLSLLNKEKLELQSKLSILEKNSNFSESTDDLLNEIEDLRIKLTNLTNNVFTKIGSSALPNSSVGCRLLSGRGRFNNIRFAFAGSAESRKGTYKCLLDEFRSSKGDIKYLIVDLVSETSVDYVFEAKLVPGIEWFRKGGSLQRYLSSTILKNTKVLSVGLGYINDSYFLCIDWAKRLVELENSGYKVVLFCGDISNVIGRVLHESFASYGDSVIYVVGNSIGSRTIVTNLRGLSNAKDSVVAYYDFNSAMKKFYDKVSKTNECRILSERILARR